MNDFTASEIEQLLQRLNQLEAQAATRSDEIEELRQASASSSRTTSPHIYEPKIADPEPFSGDRSKLMNFISQCRLKFAGQPSRFPTELAKIHYTGSYLRQQAYSWFEPMLALSQTTSIMPSEFESFEVFATALKTVYGDPDIVASSERELHRLHQTTSVSQYTAEFRRLQQYVEWNDPALADCFYRGLKDNVKDRIAEQGRPKAFLELVHLAINIDARIWERLVEKKANAAFHRQPSTFMSPRPQQRQMPSSYGGPTPMELDVLRTQTGPLTAAERQYRKEKNLCYYCGKGGHSIRDCPSTPGQKPSGTMLRPRLSETSAFESPASNFLFELPDAEVHTAKEFTQE